jgi:hypothetical protein
LDKFPRWRSTLLQLLVIPFPFLIPSHDLTFCFEVVNARDIIIPQFISRVKDDIIQVATRQAAIYNDLSYDSDEDDEDEEISSNDSTDEEFSDNEDSRGLGMRLPYQFIDIETFELLMEKLELILDGFKRQSGFRRRISKCTHCSWYRPRDRVWCLSSPYLPLGGKRSAFLRQWN